MHSAKRGVGDVLISWENEAYPATREPGPDTFEIVTPSLSVLAEPPVNRVGWRVARFEGCAVHRCHAPAVLARRFSARTSR